MLHLSNTLSWSGQMLLHNSFDLTCRDPAVLATSDLARLLRLLRLLMRDSMVVLQRDVHRCWLGFLHRFTGPSWRLAAECRSGLVQVEVALCACGDPVCGAEYFPNISEQSYFSTIVFRTGIY